MSQSVRHAHTADPKPTSSWKAVVVAFCSVGAAVFVLRSSSEAQITPRSAAVARAEAETRVMIEDRMAVHLRRLR